MIGPVGEGGLYPEIGRGHRTANERALDEQHELIRRLEAVVDWYRRRGLMDRKPAQRAAGLLDFEQKQREMLRRRVQRERARPGG